MHTIKKGLDLHIDGKPEQKIYERRADEQVGIVAADYVGLRARLFVAEGDRVARGAVLFEDRSRGVRYTAPGAGRVVAIHRRARRQLMSIVIDLSAEERAGRPSPSDLASFSSFSNRRPSALVASEIRDLLIESGLWTALRTRPFSRVPACDAIPDAIFVNAMDTQPLAAAPFEVISTAPEDFRIGLSLLAKLAAGPTYLCVAAAEDLGGEVDPSVVVERFSGPHPAGTSGLHVHRLFPVGRDRGVWTIGYQDVIAVGELARTGRLPVGRVIAIGGPVVRQPRLLRTRLGASIAALMRNEVEGPDVRVISGSVWHGRMAADGPEAFLGRYHVQITALPGRTVVRSGSRAWLSSTLTRLGLRAAVAAPGPILPLGRYERIWPFELLPTFLLRALAAGDLEQAEKLGCLELDEEDLALCSFVCPGRNDFGVSLRDALCRARDEWDEEVDAQRA